MNLDVGGISPPPTPPHPAERAKQLGFSQRHDSTPAKLSEGFIQAFLTYYLKTKRIEEEE